MDKARTKTDKQLKIMERDIGRMYKVHPALIKIEKEYKAYMDMVDKRTKSSYLDFVRESNTEHKADLKKVYIGELEALTVKSKQYQNIIKKFVDIMAQVNQDALDIVNSYMISIYTENYNQVATECRKVGIKVDESGKK